MELIKYKLSDVAKVEISGVDKKTKEGEMSVKLCNFTDVYHNWAITKNLENSFMQASANANEIRRFSIKKGQVAFTKDSEKRDDIGIATYIADDFDNVILGYHCALIIPDDSKVSGAYINAFMQTYLIKKYFSDNASGSGQRYTLTIDTMNNMPLFLPSLPEQKRIASILSTLDRKIALNRQINQNLEALARQLYDYWFVQFDFPNKEGKPYKSSGGKMVYNPILKREIPEGWEVKKLFDAVDVLYGFPFNADLFTEKETNIPVVRIRDILEGNTTTYTTENVHERYKLEAQDVLVGMDGNFHMSIWNDNISYLNQRCVRLRTLKESNISALQLFYSIQPYIKYREKTIIGSTVGHLSDKDMKALYVVEPKTNPYFSPRTILELMSQQIIENKQQIKDLTKQRDELLPLLMNGQVNFDLLVWIVIFARK